MTTGSAPDLKSGFIRNESDGNSWSTEIQSVLKCGSDAVADTYYLSHECRFENVPFSKGYLGGKEEIFQKAKPFEFLTCSLNGKFHQLVVMDFMYKNELFGDFTGVDVFCVNHLSPPSGDSHVECSERPVTYFDHDAIFDLLEGNSVSTRELFVEVRWTQQDGIDYVLHAPSRYINFGAAKGGGHFIQPIIGSVLYRDHHGAFFPAYVGAASNGKEWIVEFMTPQFRNAYAMTLNNYGTEELLEKMKPLFMDQIPLAVRTMDRTLAVDGTFRIFRYDE
ncbi:MAG: hypothetical protein ACTSV1_09180 [Alphaproteobacteria bacterium]